MQRWANMRAAQPLLDETLQHLIEFQPVIKNATSKIPDITVLDVCNSKLAKYCLDYPSNYPLNDVDLRNPQHTQALLSEIEVGINYIHTLPFSIFIGYLSDAAASETPPYQFATTRSLIRPTGPIPSSVQFRTRVVRALNKVMENHRELFQTCDNPHWLDEVFRLMLTCWGPPDSGGLPWEVLNYVNCRKSRDSVSRLGSTLSESAWTAVPRSICAKSDADPSGLESTMALTAVWRICRAHKFRPSGAYPSAFRELIASVCRTGIPHLTPSVVAMAKFCFFRALSTMARNLIVAPRDIVRAFNDPHFPSETSIAMPDPEEAESQDLNELRRLVGHRCIEAELATLSEFMECCISADLPYESADMIVHIAPAGIESTIHRVHQRRFAKAVSALFNAAVNSPHGDGLAKTILGLRLFYVYVAEDVSGSLCAWLDDPDARNSMKTTLTAYLARLSSADTEDTLCKRAGAIVNTQQSRFWDKLSPAKLGWPSLGIWDGDLIIHPLCKEHERFNAKYTLELNVPDKIDPISNTSRLVRASARGMDTGIRRL
ncbi:hypothetical protein C8R47DRAFT_1081852 [Mycena vitilis]|nr:hypothetical protein C8R47DRAFT_1081852 [Mycena vitilis]